MGNKMKQLSKGKENLGNLNVRKADNGNAFKTVFFTNVLISKKF